MNVNLDVTVDIKNIDEAQDRANKLVATIKEAKTLAGDLALALEKLSVDVDVEGD